MTRTGLDGVSPGLGGRSSATNAQAEASAAYTSIVVARAPAGTTSGTGLVFSNTSTPGGISEGHDSWPSAGSQISSIVGGGEDWSRGTYRLSTKPRTSAAVCSACAGAGL